MNDAFCRIAANYSRNTSVCNGFPFINDSAKILFCKNRIYHCHRLEAFQTISFRINEHCQLIFFQKTLRFIFILRQKTLHILYFGMVFIYCLTECHISADCRWMCDFQYQYRKPTYYQIFHINLAFLPSDFHPFYLITKSADMK